MCGGGSSYPSKPVHAIRQPHPGGRSDLSTRRQASPRPAYALGHTQLAIRHSVTSYAKVKASSVAHNPLCPWEKEDFPCRFSLCALLGFAPSPGLAQTPEQSLVSVFGGTPEYW